MSEEDGKPNAASMVADALQDPLPESTFFYRRIYSYVTSVVILGLLGFIIYRMDDAAQLRPVAGYLCILLFCVITYYMIAPSGEQVVKMVQTAKMFVSGVRVRPGSADEDCGEDRPTTRRPRRGSDFESARDYAPTSRRRGRGD